MKIFYSWQSDIPVNRSFVQKCLENAIKSNAGYEVETATRNAAGAVDISGAIQAKINECDLFVADVTIINNNVEGRKTPNPNVLYELGYAVGKKGDHAVILIADKTYTETADLPFDIRNRLIILRNFNKESESMLTRELKEIIECYQQPVKVLDHPYIYLQHTSYGSGSMSLTAINDESDQYLLESVEIGGIEAETRIGLPAKADLKNIAIRNIPLPPFEKRINTISFTVSRLNKAFRIFQRLNLSNREDGLFNLETIDPSPFSITEVPLGRRAEITELDPNPMGSSQKVHVTNT